MRESDVPEPRMFGQRVRRVRERRGLTRAVVGGLVGRSAEWVKAVENGRLQMPRLPLLLRLADVLGVQDLAELTGGDTPPPKGGGFSARAGKLPASLPTARPTYVVGVLHRLHRQRRPARPP